MAKAIALILAFEIVPRLIIAQDQLLVKTGIKAGYEFADYFSSVSNSFKKVPGSTFGLFTGIALDRNSKSLAILGIELNYLKLLYYRNNQQIFYDESTGYLPIQYYGVFDEKISDEFVELCLPLEFWGPIFNKNISMGLYFGPSIGLGNENMEVREKSRTLIDTLKYPGGFNPDPEGSRYSYPGGSSICVPVSIVVGFTFAYDFLVVDLRYKYTTHISGNNDNIYFQVGLAY